MKVYLSEYIHPAAIEKLKSEAVIVDNFDTIEELDGMIVRGVPVTRDILKRAVNLKAVGRHGVGYETVDLQAAKEYGVRVLNVPRANAASVAEMIVARFLEMSRDLYKANSKLRAGAFNRIAPPDLLGSEVSGKNLGLIGMGNIARLAADMMRAAFKVKVYGYDPFIPAEDAIKYDITKKDTLEELLEVSDLVTISVGLTAETQNMINGEVFDHFRENAIFVNTSRGGVVNEKDLYQALISKKLRAAAFDVFEKEPLAKDSPLLQLDNFSATPHIGGNTEEALYRTGMAVVDNVLKVIKGEPAEGIVV